MLGNFARIVPKVILVDRTHLLGDEGHHAAVTIVGGILPQSSAVDRNNPDRESA
jgi:hypothetical protein